MTPGEAALLEALAQELGPVFLQAIEALIAKINPKSSAAELPSAVASLAAKVQALNKS